MAEPCVGFRAVPPLVGQLPPQCRTDVDALRRVVYATLAREAPAASRSPADFREVLLTGATGFVGRFLLRELLAQNDCVNVHCLVRAESPGHGFERIRDALEHAEIWEDEFAPRLRVVPGDISEERFGLGDTRFEDLCRNIDAVYHLSANVDVVASYADLREANVLGLRPVLELCLRMRYKHLFYVSTMGVFPAYSYNFAREYRQDRIDDQVQPDLSAMKKAFPLGAIGYPWSKLVAEQGVLFAKAAGVPIGIFRLPLTGLSSTGYTQANDLPTRLFAAAAQLEKAPKGLTIQKNGEPIDTVCEICVAISLNPNRSFVIYHCCDPKPPYEDVEAADFGFYWQAVSYESFRSLCRGAGDTSPLCGRWALVDRFAPYWFGEKRAGSMLPIGDRAIREDCPHPITWPALLIRHARFYDRIRRHPAGWPYPLPRARLDFKGLVGQAGTYAERMGVPFEQSCPEWMRAGLEQLVEALKSPESGLRESRRSDVIYGLTRSLRNNAALAREGQQHPEIERVEITRPIFVVGIDGTATTFLHRLLACDPQFRALRRYELTEPVLSTGEYGTVAGTAEDPRRLYAEEVMKATDVADTFSGIHHTEMGEPEEDLLLLRLTFSTWAMTVAHHVPAYGPWLAETGSRDAYAHHRRILQHFTWQRRQREAGRQRFWLLESPFHLRELEVVLETYPDAVFIQTHREPAQFMASWNRRVERIRSSTTESRPRHETGAEQLAFMSGMLNDTVRFRASRTALSRRWVDVRHADLIDEPMAVVNDVYARFGWLLESAAVDAMQEWLSLQEEQRRQEARREHGLEGYGLTPEAVDEAFAPYRDFVAARGIM